jgi:hypothetical protein
MVGDPFCYIGATNGTTTPAPADYDYDQKADMPMYNPATGQWRIRGSLGADLLISWGGPGYTAVPGDYDGDGRYDAAVYNQSAGLWYILTSRSNFTRAFTLAYGGPGYEPVQADYDGDGTTDSSLAHTTAFTWTFLLSSVNFTGLSGISGFGGPGYRRQQQYSTAIIARDW